MTQHTPGPWTVGYKDDQCVYAGGKHLATVQCDQKRNWAANARLIAAAPDGLAANKMALAYMTETSRDEDPDAWAIVDALRAAIAKATGSP